jgi:tetratricopeptide (TPR) repeat protein
VQAPAARVETPPPPPPAPRVPTPQEKQRAEQLANESVNILQAGDMAAGRGMLDQALALDPNNELARLLMKQLTVDPVAELGSASFTYIVQPGETLAILAQKFLADRHLFLILARYNNIAQANRISAGQSIKIPGKQRSGDPAAGARPTPPAPAPKPQPPPPPTTPPAPPEGPFAKPLAEAREHERRGDLERAFSIYNDILRRDPQHAEAGQRAADVRRRLIDRYSAEATKAFSKQDMDKAIAAWDRVLQLDPDNANAKAKRQQAVYLRDQLKKFDSNKK